MAMCGTRTPAVHRQAYCSACDALGQINPDQPEADYQHQIDAIFNKLDRIQRIHRLYGQRHRR